MNLYITKDLDLMLRGTIISPDQMNANLAHLVIASRHWDAAYVDVDECIEEGKLRHLHSVCDKLYAKIPDNPSKHQMILLTELFPSYAGTIRKAFLKGDSFHGLLPFVWEHGAET